MPARSLLSSRSFVACNVRIDVLMLESAAKTVETLALKGGSRSVHLCSANNLALATRDLSYAAVLNRGDINLPDGTPLMLLARWVGIPGVSQAQRPRGASLLSLTVDQGRASGLRHAFYGSDERTLAALRDRLETRYPGVEIAFMESPPFRDLTADEELAVVQRLTGARPHIIWVALGTPGQDYFIDRACVHIGTLLVGVGAAFDFLAGTKKEAPLWMQRIGLEWLFRLANEPQRLWKRYLLGNLIFFRGLARGVTIAADSDDHGRVDGPLDGTARS